MTRLLHLHQSDNVLVALCALPAGTKANGFTLQSDISLAHKVAARHIAAGEDVLKYGMVIGRATKAIKSGEHVHVHNLASKYTQTHYRQYETS